VDEGLLRRKRTGGAGLLLLIGLGYPISRRSADRAEADRRYGACLPPGGRGTERNERYMKQYNEEQKGVWHSIWLKN
jgi:hypothetical protein